MLVKFSFAQNFEVLFILENTNNFVHASKLAKKLRNLNAVKFMNKTWYLIKEETLQKKFARWGFVVNQDVVTDDNEIAKQEEELANLASKVGINRDKLVIEENLTKFEVVEEQTLILQLIKEHNDVADENDSKESILESKNLKEPYAAVSI